LFTDFRPDEDYVGDFQYSRTTKLVPGPGRVGLHTETAGIARVVQALRD
jgi:hypothetical protein